MSPFCRADQGSKRCLQCLSVNCFWSRHRNYLFLDNEDPADRRQVKLVVVGKGWHEQSLWFCEHDWSAVLTPLFQTSFSFNTCNTVPSSLLMVKLPATSPLAAAVWKISRVLWNCRMVTYHIQLRPRYTKRVCEVIYATVYH
jgi:hypothetical protein